MINLKDQNELFLLIATYLEEDVECIAFGGTAMMYYDIKDTTKDIDLFFKTEKERSIFIKAIEKIGYKKREIITQVYSDKKSANKYAPLMFTRDDDERFDLFAEKIFQTEITDTILQRVQQLRDFNSDKKLQLSIISPEDLVLLKAVTSRAKDMEDIQSIVQKSETFDWSKVIFEAKRQNEWTIIDLEEKMQLLKDVLLIKEKYFDLLYGE